MRISAMHIGQKGCIVKVKGHGSARKRAVDAGFYKGICVEVLDMGDGSFSIEGRLSGADIRGCNLLVQ